MNLQTMARGLAVNKAGFGLPNLCARSIFTVSFVIKRFRTLEIYHLIVICFHRQVKDAARAIRTRAITNINLVPRLFRAWVQGCYKHLRIKVTCAYENFRLIMEKNIHLCTCRKRFSGLQPTQSQPAQQIRDQVNVNFNTDAEMEPTSSPSPKVWGTHTKQDVHVIIDAIYDEILYFGEGIYSKLFEYWNQDAVNFKDIALKVFMVMPALLLQKPTFKSTSKEHSQCLTRRLKQWEAGDFDGLPCEIRTIQGKLPTNLKPLNDERLVKTFSKLICLKER
jgi:hypothetical protein